MRAKLLAYLSDMGARIVVIKGGHRPGAPIDLVFDGISFGELSADRIDTENTHGTGCTFSAAITANLALGFGPLESIARAKLYLTEALRTQLSHRRRSFSRQSLSHTRASRLASLEGAHDVVRIQRPRRFRTRKLTIGGKTFDSRLMLGTGKYRDSAEMNAAFASAGAEIITVALRRIDFDDPKSRSVLEDVDWKKYTILPNTAGCQTAEEAIRIARMARALELSDWVKVEVIPDPKYLLPDPIGTYEACKVLVQEGFTVLPYIGADPILAQRLAGARHRDGDAARIANWLRTGIGQHRRDSHHHRAGGSAGRGRRWNRSAVRCRSGDGSRSRCGAGEHGSRIGGRSGADGVRDGRRRIGWPQGVSGRSHSAKSLRLRQQSARRSGWRAIVSSKPLTDSLRLYLVAGTAGCTERTAGDRRSGVGQVE